MPHLLSQYYCCLTVMYYFLLFPKFNIVSEKQRQILLKINMKQHILEWNIISNEKIVLNNYMKQSIWQKVEGKALKQHSLMAIHNYFTFWRIGVWFVKFAIELKVWLYLYIFVQSTYTPTTVTFRGGPSWILSFKNCMFSYNSSHTIVTLSESSGWVLK